MEDVIVIAVIIFGFLQIVLFFKIWKMTNDVSTMKYYLSQIVKNTSYEDEDKEIPQGTNVIEIKTGRKMNIGEILPDGKYKCYIGMSYVGDFSVEEISSIDS